jgi:hypothetical protein
MRVKYKDSPKLKWDTEDIMQMSYKVRARPVAPSVRAPASDAPPLTGGDVCGCMCM